ncbi:hypothetical protein [Pseudomonas sp. NPDC099000]|uniref:hypothetical protein n=1 Tax=Pseudomonas sp. NPDC099000 TaxID=3364488 RepID=UPI00383A9886
MHPRQLLGEQLVAREHDVDERDTLAAWFAVMLMKYQSWVSPGLMSMIPTRWSRRPSA